MNKRVGERMGQRLRSVRETLETLLQTCPKFNLKELADQLDIPVDAAKAVSQYKVNRLRNMVYDIGHKLDLHVFCDYQGNVVVVRTLEDVQDAINSKLSQVTGRGEQMLFYMAIREQIRANSKRRHVQRDPNQLTLADLAPDDAFLASQFSAPAPVAPVVALRAKDLESTRREFMSILLANPKLMDDFGLAACRYYQLNYGFEVPAALFSPGVIQPQELHEIWQQLVTGLRRLAGQPDLMRQVSGRDGVYH